MLAARMLELPPAECLAVEDAKASIKDAQRGRVDTADIGDAADAPSVTYRLKIVPDLAADLV